MDQVNHTNVSNTRRTTVSVCHAMLSSETMTLDIGVLQTTSKASRTSTLLHSRGVCPPPVSFAVHEKFMLPHTLHTPRRDAEEYMGDRRRQQQHLQSQQDVVLDDMSAALSRLGDVSGTINVELGNQAMELDAFHSELDQAESNMAVVHLLIYKSCTRVLSLTTEQRLQVPFILPLFVFGSLVPALCVDSSPYTHAIKVMTKLNKLLGTSDKGKICCIFALLGLCVFLFALIVYT